MKKNISKILALIIAISSLISVFSVFSFAVSPVADSDVTSYQLDESRELLYNRTFDDGWDALNNFDGSIGKHKAEINYEVGDDGNYNYYAYYEYGNEKAALNLALDLKGDGLVIRNGMSVISLSIKADDLCDLGTILSVNLYNHVVDKKAISTPVLIIDGYDLWAFSTSKGSGGILLGSLQEGDWFDVDVVFDWRDKENLSASAYVDNDFAGTYSLPEGKNGLEKITLGWGEGDGTKGGMGFCLDNLFIYQSANLTGRVEKLEKYGYGKFVSLQQEKTIPIYKNENDKNPDKIIEEALYMKLGVKSALLAGQRENIASAPVMVDGKVMIPLDTVLDYLGYPKFVHPDKVSYDVTTTEGTTYITMGRDTASVNGELVNLSVMPGLKDGYAMIGLDDVPTLFPGMAIAYDDMGLIIVCEDIFGGTGVANITREENLDQMIDTMKKFVFDVEAGNKEEDYIKTGEDVYQDAKSATDFIHPYIITDQESFDKLNSIYEGEDSVLKGYIETVLSAAKLIYADMAKEEAGAYVGFKDGKKPVNVWADGKNPMEADDPETEGVDETTIVKDSPDGYNSDDLRLYEVEEAAGKLVELAFAYQVTRDAKYAELAYDIMLALGEWTHWGPGYMANCANAAASYAIAFDWLYGYVEKNKEEGANQKLATILYDKAISHGVASSKGSFCQFPRESGFGDRYVTRTDSYNAICSSGMIIASLAIMNESIEIADQDITAAISHKDILYLIGNNLRNLADYGLDQYAPDGSYVESATYWALGTNAFMKTVMSLESATGNDYGFKNVWGVNKSFYFACYIVNGNGEAWKYHEDGVGFILEAGPLTVDTQMFNYAGKIYGDEKLIAIRDKQIKGGKSVTMFDVLFYPDGEITADTTLELDYYMEGIDAFVSRSGWEADDLFVGMMGGMNAYSPYGDNAAGDSMTVWEGDKSLEIYGQIDSGNFVYENRGVKWIVDHGSDGYTASTRYFGEYRFNNFRNSGEGHNVMLIPGLLYGQDPKGGGKMTETFVDPNGRGSYAIIDNSGVYSTSADSAKRGMLITNDRKAVIIQDEMSFGKSVGNATWVINTFESIELDKYDPHTAYLVHKNDDGSNLYLRATIVTAQDNVKFSVVGAQNLFNATKNEYTVNSLDGLSRLAIKVEGMLTLAMAVVFEVVESKSEDTGFVYEYKSLDVWNALFDSSVTEEEEEKYDSDTSKFRELIDYAAVIYDDYTHLTVDMATFFEKLCHAQHILVENRVFDYKGDYNPSGYDPASVDEPWYEDYVQFMDEYAEYRSTVMTTVNEINKLTKVLSGQ